jgi:hypothetical protein
MSLSMAASFDDRYCHEPDMPPWSPYVRCWGQSGKHMLALSFSVFDPGCVKTPSML